MPISGHKRNRTYFLQSNTKGFQSCRKALGDNRHVIIRFRYEDPSAENNVLRYESEWHYRQNRIISSFVLSSDNTNCKNDIQLFLQLFDELRVYRDYH